MARLRGKPLGYVALALAAWAGGRIAWERDLRAPVDTTTPSVARAGPTSPKALPGTDEWPVRRLKFPPQSSQKISISGLQPAFRSPPALDPWQDGSRPPGSSHSVLVAGGGEPLSTGRDTPPSIALAPVGEAGLPEVQRRWGGDVYAYGFWRAGSGARSALAPGAQYGGSQSGLIATLDPFGNGQRGVALLLRGSITPDGSEKEMALGLRWRPSSNWPLTLSAERRFGIDAPDRFAAYASGGVDGVRLWRGIKLDAYGQSGWVTGRGGGPFFDAQAKATHALAEIGGVPVRFGAGSWAGGQKGAARLDAGPTVEALVDTSLAKFRLQVDWRQRLAGNALPKSGLAFTVSTGF